MRDAVMDGVAQLMTYRDWFDDRRNRKPFRSAYGLTAFRPRVVLVIGRCRSFYDDVERMRLESLLTNGVQLTTYDDIVARRDAPQGVPENFRYVMLSVVGDGQPRAYSVADGAVAGNCGGPYVFSR